MEKLLSKFLFESWKVDFNDIDMTVEEFVANNVSEQEFLSTLTDMFNKLAKAKYKGMELSPEKLAAISDFSFGVYRSYFNDNPIVRILFSADTEQTAINNTFIAVLSFLGRIEYLGFLNPKIKDILLDGLTNGELYRLLGSTTSALFHKSSFAANDKEKYEAIENYLNSKLDGSKEIFGRPIDLEIKGILNEYLDEQFDKLGSKIAASVKSNTNVLTTTIPKFVISKILLSDYSFNEFRKDTGFNLTNLSSEQLNINFEVFNKLKETWNEFEGLIVMDDSSSEQLSAVDQRFKITLINLCIGLKKYLEEIKQVFSNKLMVAWLDKLLVNLNSFLRTVKENRSSGFGFSIFPISSKQNRGLSTLVTRDAIKRFLTNDQGFQDLFPRKTKDLMNALKAYKIFFEFLRSLNYAGEQLYFDKRIEFPELLSTVIG